MRVGIILCTLGWQEVSMKEGHFASESSSNALGCRFYRLQALAMPFLLSQSQHFITFVVPLWAVMCSLLGKFLDTKRE